MGSARHAAFVDSGLQLAPGRYQATFEEVSHTWAFNVRRRELLDELQTLIAALQKTVPIQGVWISGSYISGKAEPSDIDASIHVDADLVEALPASERFRLTQQGISILASQLRLRVDAYLLPWRSITAPDLGAAAQQPYYLSRGYWDDWWMRTRGGTKREQSTPRRGYVEVRLDGY